MRRDAMSDRAALDRPWRRPGSWAYAWERVDGLLRPRVDVTAAPAGAVRVDRDVPVEVRDGTVLRVNVHRPGGGAPVQGPFPVVLCAHPYGKDAVPRRGWNGRWRVPFQYRLLRQTSRVAFSDLTSWEAPDPLWWTQQGFVVVNADLRGVGRSGGCLAPFSRQEGEDVHDLVEWAARQGWSTGAVGMLGVSYLAVTQWQAAATRPPHLRAIVPWEGLTDPYRDLLRPGGIQETGFVAVWRRGLRSVRVAYDLATENRRRPLRDEFWQALVPDLAAVDVPTLVCGSFSDNNLHSRGSIRGYEQISSVQKHLYTHRGGKWATFYSASARQEQAEFLDAHLRGTVGPAGPRVRVEVREDRDRIVAVREETSWPPSASRWTSLHLGDRGLGLAPATDRGSIAFDARRRGVRFGWNVPDDLEIVGPMAARLFVQLEGADDADLFVGVEKWRGGRYVPFEGSYGFGRDRVSTGWSRLSLRRLDEVASRPFDPVPLATTSEPVGPGQVVTVDVALGPSATLFRAGEQLRFVVAGRWLWPRNPLTGQFPAAYATRPQGRCTLHWGPDRSAALLVPVGAGSSGLL